MATEVAPAPEPRWSGLRSALWWLALATAVGTLVELATLRHWGDGIQMAPRVAIVATIAMLGLFADAAPRSSTVHQDADVARAVAGAHVGAPPGTRGGSSTSLHIGR